MNATPDSTGRLDEALDTVRQQGELIRQLLMEKYEPIAVVGVGLRLPGGNDSLPAFTEFLRNGGSATVPVPEERWKVEDLAKPGKTASQAGGFLENLDLFDARFFNISPKSAHWIDPQQRILMETAWEALENANIDPTALRHSNGGVYIGASNMDYAMELEGIAHHDLDGSVAAGVSHSGLCGRLSYFLGWRGPSIALDTACSASLVALHYAVEGLRRGECDIALCGGVNAMHHPRTSALFTDLQALAPDGRCKTFDDSADGYGRAEGCGVLVLKRMSDAKRDHDTVLALVRGTAVGQDGESAGFYVPNGTAQEQVMRRALTAAALEPGDIQFVEAHGTGTPLGDPIEMGSISEVFGDSHDAAAPVVVSSLKANIGHMEPAAGVGGVLKTVAQMREGMFFPHVHFETPSTRIPWPTSPVTVPTRCGPWQADTRRAVVNSFGFTGTLAAAVLEEAPKALSTGEGTPEAAEDGAGHVFTLSAKSRQSLRGQIELYQAWLERRSDLDVGAVCYTANVGRAHFAHRVRGVVRSLDELKGLLADRLARLDDEPESEDGRIRKVAFLFTGQGAQHVGMGAGLYRRHSVFRQTVDECDELFAPLLGRSIKAMMFGEAPDSELVHQTRYTQPALFVLEYALAKLWLSWGVRPSVMVGHSIGEVVAAAVAGLFGLADAVTLVAARARLMDGVSAPGGMAAVRAGAETVGPLLDAFPDLAIAAVNAPAQVVVSGGSESLEKLAGELAGLGIDCKRLPVSHAFHSPLMREITDDFRAVLEGIEFREPELSFISNLTGDLARWRQISRPDYWVRHAMEPVQFTAGMRTAERRGRHAFIEIGPSTTLSSLAKRCVSAADHVWLNSLKPAAHGDEALLKAVARLYGAGLPFSWPAFHGPARRSRIDLPTYSFDRKRYWLPTTERTLGGHGGDAPLAQAPVVARPAEAPPAPSLTAEELAGLEPAERVSAVSAVVRQRVSDILGFGGAAEVEPGADFSELGMDSLAAVEIRDALQSTLGVSLPLSALYDHPTARQLATFLDERLRTEPSPSSV